MTFLMCNLEQISTKLDFLNVEKKSLDSIVEN